MQRGQRRQWKIVMVVNVADLIGLSLLLSLLIRFVTGIGRERRRRGIPLQQCGVGGCIPYIHV
jgi:hypothetical protein